MILILTSIDDATTLWDLWHMSRPTLVNVETKCKVLLHDVREMRHIGVYGSTYVISVGEIACARTCQIK